MKHIYLLITVFLLVAGNVLAQELQVAKYNYSSSGWRTFQYSLNEWGDTIMNGFFVDTLLYRKETYNYSTDSYYNTYRIRKGQYAQGKATGTWEYFEIIKSLSTGKIWDGEFHESVQYKDGILDGWYEVERKSASTCHNVFGPFYYYINSRGRGGIPSDRYNSKGYYIHSKVLYENGVQREFIGELQWNAIHGCDPDDQPIPIKFSLSGKFNNDGVPQGIWIDCGDTLYVDKFGKSEGFNKKYNKQPLPNPKIVFNDTLGIEDGDVWGTYSLHSIKPSYVNMSRLPELSYLIDTYFWSDDSIYQPKIYLISRANRDEIEKKFAKKWCDSYCKFVFKIYDDGFVSEKNPYTYSIKNSIKERNRSIPQYINKELFSFFVENEREICLLLPYNTIKENLKKIASIVEKTQCQNYINYNDFIETCNERWDIIENSNKDRQYDTYKKDRRYTIEIEKLQVYVEKTLQKCEKLNSYNETNNKIVASKSPTEAISKYSLAYNELYNKLCNETNAEKQAEYEKEIEALQKNTQEKCEKLNSYNETHNKIVVNKAKKAIVTKYSIAYNELFHNLCNETNVEKQGQYEKDIEDLQSKTQEICSVTDTKAFEKQLKSASGGEQIKTMIINYK